MSNVRAVLAATGLELEDVVKTTLFLVDLADGRVVDEVYGACFATSPPARATIQMAALPRGARVEIEAIAVKA